MNKIEEILKAELEGEDERIVYKVLPGMAASEDGKLYKDGYKISLWIPGYEAHIFSVFSESEEEEWAAEIAYNVNEFVTGKQRETV